MRALTSTKEKSSLSLTHKKKVLSRKEPLLLRRLLPRALSLSLPPIERRSCKSFSSFKFERESCCTSERKEEMREVSTFFGQKTERKKNQKKEKRRREISLSLSLRFIHSFFSVCVFFSSTRFLLRARAAAAAATATTTTSSSRARFRTREREKERERERERIFFG